MIPYGSIQIMLQGQLPEIETCSLIQLFHIASDSTSTVPSPLDPAVQAILDEFAAVFAEPVGLPPRRSCDHTIPLVQGAQPVSARPYRYAPALKSEIEAQVTDMPQSGLIQPSTGVFSSPALLVHKKDGGWRFCVDYRMLNALTIKSKFPFLQLLTSYLMNSRALSGFQFWICGQASIKLDWLWGKNTRRPSKPTGVTSSSPSCHLG